MTVLLDVTLVTSYLDTLGYSHGVLAEEVAGDHFRGEDGAVVNVFLLFLLVNVVVAVVLGAAADVSEGLEARCGGRVCVDVDGVGALDVLKQSHCRVTCVILHHFRVGLTRLDIECWVLEDASLAIRALGGVL